MEILTRCEWIWWFAVCLSGGLSGDEGTTKQGSSFERAAQKRSLQVQNGCGSLVSTWQTDQAPKGRGTPKLGFSFGEAIQKRCSDVANGSGSPLSTNQLVQLSKDEDTLVLPQPLESVISP